MPRSIAAVTAGYITMTLFVILMFVLLGILFPHLLANPDAIFSSLLMIATILIFSFLAAAAGGIVTAKLAKTNPLKHVKALTVVVFILGIISLALTAGQPLWYQLALIILGVAGVHVGGKKYLSRKSKPASNS